MRIKKVGDATKPTYDIAQETEADLAGGRRVLRGTWVYALLYRGRLLKLLR
jgi:hypothetical protein